LSMIDYFVLFVSGIWLIKRVVSASPKTVSPIDAGFTLALEVMNYI
jgi:hypothetical protein